MSEVAKCALCGEPMPPGEEMFQFHGYSGPCPKPPLPPRRFRKKPVVIDAIRAVPQTDDPGDARWGPVQRWALQWDAGEDWVYAPDRIAIPTLEGVMSAEVGDWIIRGVKGEFYPCKPDIFEATYDSAEA